MLNERDGGIGGVKLIVEECETGYDTKKGVECYESVKGKNPVVINPYSTGITLQLIPKAAVDKIPILSMAYGLSASADGNQFPWIFNPPATYWDGASMIIKLRRRQGRRPRQAQGQDDRLHLSRRALRQGADPAAASRSPRTTASSSSSIRCRRPRCRTSRRCGSTSAATAGLDGHVGLGRHEPDRGQGSGQDQLPDGPASSASGGRATRTMRVRPAPEAKGYSSLNFNAVGADFPAIQDILKYVVDKGKSQIAEGQGRRELLQPRRL